MPPILPQRPAQDLGPAVPARASAVSRVITAILFIVGLTVPKGVPAPRQRPREKIARSGSNGTFQSYQWDARKLPKAGFLGFTAQFTP